MLMLVNVSHYRQWSFSTFGCTQLLLNMIQLFLMTILFLLFEQSPQLSHHLLLSRYPYVLSKYWLKQKYANIVVDCPFSPFYSNT